MVVPLSSYSTASHAKGRFFCASVKGKNIIKSRHIRVNCVHFQSQHGLVFAQFFFFFFLSFLTVIVVVVVLLGKTVWLQSRAATNLRGLHISENRAIHTCKFFNHHRSVWFPVPFWLLLQFTSIYFGLLWNQPFLLNSRE